MTVRRRRALLVAAALAAWLALLALGRPQAARAQQAPAAPPIEVQVTLDPPEVRLGERAQLTLTLAHGDDVLTTVAAPRLPDPLRLIAADPPTSVSSGRRVVTSVRYTLAGFDLGTLQPPPLSVSWLRLDGSGGVLQVAVPPLRVLPTLTGAERDLRSLKPQAALAGAPAAWLRPAGAAALLTLLAGGLAVLAIARRRRAAPAAVPAAAATPEDEARRLLDELAAARLLQGGD
ncbi:MAG: hypothetical protein EXR65_03375, partial [Dehalococcoidia bacterium]|nr:hypothetical protein [Dehalococcoidia bacterium]